ncbi:MAG: type II toxin-antitoxin system VapC family toxin [Anaerolineae bacterium]|nr:type II toxin-antitoxin system VapC family toxin [Anaerolineae bacterium]
MTVLIDTSVLLAYAFSRDQNHALASRTLRALNQERRIVVTPVLSELFYMTMVRVNYARAIQMFASTRAAFEIQQLTDEDMTRMIAIMEQYKDAEFDFTDVAIMALAERLNIQRICTFDRRGFVIIHPPHCDYFELLP